MPHIISIANQKGGVGKTTSAVNISAILASRQYKVLLIDIDAQGNAGSGLGVDKNSVASGVYEVLVENLPIQEAILHTEIGLDLLPVNIHMDGIQMQMMQMDQRNFLLKKALQPVISNYHFIFIDTPPSLGILTLNALAVSSSILIPLQAEYYALEGLAQLVKTITLVKNSINPELQLGGVMITMYDARTNLSQQVLQEVKSYFGKQLYKSIIQRNIKLSEAPSFGQPIHIYAPQSVGAKNYMDLVDEILQHYPVSS